MVLRITVVVARQPRVVQEQTVELAPGATVADALAASALGDSVVQDSDGRPLLAVWGRKAAPDQALRDQDRVELLRPLKVDPKLARRARFVRQGVRAAGLFARKRPGGKAGY